MRKPPFVPKLYRNAPRRTKDGFVQHIHEKENARGNQISMVQADEIFRILMQQSYTAKRYGRPDEIWISHDSRSGEWGGYETPFKVYGISQRIKKGSYRDKLGKLPPMSRLDMLDAIVSIYGGSIGRAEQIFNVIKQGILIFDKETNTWRGCDCTDLPTLDDAVVIEPRRTTKQEEYRARYGTMPPGRHKWKDLTKSDPVKWIAELDGVPLEEALKRYDRHWHCSRDKSKIPYVQDPETKLVRGVNYIVQVAPADRILEQRWFDRKGRPAEAGDDSADDLQYWLGGVNVTVAYCKLDLLNMPDRTMEEFKPFIIAGLGQGPFNVEVSMDAFDGDLERTEKGWCGIQWSPDDADEPETPKAIKPVEQVSTPKATSAAPAHAAYKAPKYRFTAAPQPADGSDEDEEECALAGLIG